MSDSQDISVKEIVRALDIVMMERSEQGVFRLVSEMSDWFQAIYPKFLSENKIIRQEDFSPFLEDFLSEAELFWSLESSGRLRSGLWIENDGEANEYPLEASAIAIQERKILMIERGRVSYEENLMILQKGRELHLSYQNMDRLQKQLESAAFTDKLTGLYNRQKFEELLHNEMARAIRYGIPFSIIFFDIDHFKKINDIYGHTIGDEVLKEIASLIRLKFWKTDFPFRWGGEEFIILLSATPLDRAIKAAEKLRNAIRKHYFFHVGEVTVSSGVAQFRDSDSLNTLIQRADEALYRAKSGGRNRVESEEEQAE